MGRPLQDIRIYAVQDRRSNAQAQRPWIVRRAVDGRQRSTSFRTKAEADRYRSLLVIAATKGECFDVESGEPAAWQPPVGSVRVHEWARRWASQEWIEWQPRTRTSAVEALARFVTLTVAKPPADLRRYLTQTLRPDAELDAVKERWLADHAPSLSDLDNVAVEDIERRLGLGLHGQPLAASTAARFRSVSHACLRGALDGGLLEADPWPARRRTRSKRKVTRRKGVDLRRLPGPVVMAQAIDAMPNHQAGSRTYQVMTAVAYYAGLRPSEVAMLRVRSLFLPPDGWGRIDVTEADISVDEPGEPKTGPRAVPIPRVLVEMLMQWIDERGLTDQEALLFRTRSGTRPNQSNWGRAWRRALRAVGQPSLRVYDCRHAAATMWLRAGVPFGEVARRLGHSVETLVSTYVGVLDDEVLVGNDRIDAQLSRSETLADERGLGGDSGGDQAQKSRAA
jgi:integrase